MEPWKKRYIIEPDISLNQGPAGPQGPPGANGGVGTLPLSSDDVDYRGSVLTEIIDQLLYVALEVEFFTATQLNYEKGQTLTQVQLSWEYNKAVVSQSITGTGVTPPSLLVTDRAKLVALANITTNTVITLTADDVSGDGNDPITQALTLSFLNKLYYGKAVAGTINNAFVLALPSNELKATRQKSFSVSTVAGEYIWFASPVAYGLPSFKANGFDGGFDLVSTLSFTNASGHTEDYYIFRSTNDNLGLTNVEVL